MTIRLQYVGHKSNRLATTLLDKQIKKINDAKDAAQEAADAETRAIDARIKGLEKEKQAIDDEIEKIRTARQERELELDLAKKKYDLQRMQAQKTKLVFEDGSLVYKTDDKGIRDAREEVDKTKEEIRINALEKEADLIQKQIDLLNEQKDAISERLEESNRIWDEQIKSLESYKDRWSELSSLQSDAENISALKEQLAQMGYTTEDVLNMSDEAFANFRQQYVGLLNDLQSGNETYKKTLSELTGVDSMDFSYLKETQGSIDSLSGSISTMASNFKQVGDTMQPIADSMGKAAGAIQTIADSLPKVDEVSDRTVDALNDVLEVTEEISKGAAPKIEIEYTFGEELQNEVDVQSDAVEGYKTNIDGINQSTNTTKEPVQTMNDSFADVSKTVTDTSSDLHDLNSEIQTFNTTPLDGSFVFNQPLDEVKSKIEETIKALKDLEQEVSAFKMPAPDVSDFENAFGVADESKGMLGTMAKFADRFKEICDEIPTYWQEALQKVVSGEDGVGYLELFNPLLEAMEEVRIQIQSKLQEYIQEWQLFNTNLGNIIGVNGGNTESGEGIDTTNGTSTQEGGEAGGTSSILQTVQTGGAQVAESLQVDWIDKFREFAEMIDSICATICQIIQDMCNDILQMVAQALEGISTLVEAADAAVEGGSIPDLSVAEVHSSYELHDIGSTPASRGKNGKAGSTNAYAEGTANNGFLTPRGNGYKDGKIHFNGTVLVNEIGTETLVFFCQV